jgi:predicted acetyltransferase
MPLRLRTVRDLDEQAAALSAIGHYFGWVPTRDDAERFAPLLPLDRVHAVFDDGEIVAGAGVFPFRLTVPGGALPCAGVTVVGVLPSHRRRGLLRRMMDAQLLDVRERGEPIAALWASEETIYGRFGYGLASISHNVDAERRSVAVRRELPRSGSMRLVSHDEALRTFPRLYERVGRSRPGMIVRTRDWWSIRRLDDRPEVRRGGGPLVRALLERDGRPVGYALYRLVQDGTTPETWTKTIRVSEALGIDDEATWDVWRFLLQIDWTDRVAAHHLPVDHPLPLLVDRINKLRLSVWDALWVRVVDVPAALAGRAYASSGRVTVEVTSDPHFPDNVGRWTIEGGEVRRSRLRPDVRVAVDGLGSAFLGGISFARLANAGRAEESARGGIGRVDAAFRASAAPWCAEIF